MIVRWEKHVEDAYSDLLSSKSIVLLDSFHVESMFSTCRISDCELVMSWSMTFAGIFIFSLHEHGQEMTR